MPRSRDGDRAQCKTRFQERSEGGRGVSVLDGLGNMMLFDAGYPFEVRERQGYAQDSMVGARGKRESFDTLLQQGARVALQAGQFLQASSRNSRVGEAISVALPLQVPCAKNSVPDHSAILGCNHPP